MFRDYQSDRQNDLILLIYFMRIYIYRRALSIDASRRNYFPEQIVLDPSKFLKYIVLCRRDTQSFYPSTENADFDGAASLLGREMRVLYGR